MSHKSEIPDHIKYSKTHEWARLEDDGTVTIGISDHAQKLLGDIVFVELPELESEIKTGDEVGVVESVKAASDIYSPIAGEVISANETLQDEPDLINRDPYNEGWILRVRPFDEADLDELLSAEDYAEHIAGDES